MCSKKRLVRNVTLKVTFLFFPQRTSITQPGAVCWHQKHVPSLCKYIRWISRMLSDAWAARKLLLPGRMWSCWMSDYSQGGNKDNWNSSWGNFSRTYGCWWTHWFKLRVLLSPFCWGAVVLIVKYRSALTTAAAKQHYIHILRPSKCASTAKIPSEAVVVL